MSRADRPNPRDLVCVDPPAGEQGAATGYLRSVEPADPDRRVSPLCDRSRPDDTPTSAGFRTILFPPGFETARAERREPPACFVDLNLDQVVDAIVAKRDEEMLRPIFYSPYRTEEIVRYRQAVFTDLEGPDVFQVFPIFCESMRAVGANLDYAAKISYKCHRHMVHLRAIHLYCEAVQSLRGALDRLTLRSAGLKGLRAYLARYVKSAAFVELAAQARTLRDTLSQLSYGTLFRGDKVTVRKYASEPDYTVTIRERFARFAEAKIEPPPPRRPTDDFSLNHIEEGILEFVGRLFAQEFRVLDDYATRHPVFIDDVIATFAREINFYIAYLGFIGPLKQAGLPFCYPEVSATKKDTQVSGSFDLALAAKLTRENRTVVCNDFFLRDQERLIVVTGPNQGGKTTFARMFGQLHFLAGLGCPVPGRHARLFLPDRIFTHFEREEEITNLRGKLADELVRLRRTCEAMTSDSAVVLNEIFNSTSLDDQIFLGTKVLQRILATDAIGVCVTFIDALSTLGEKTVSMASTVMPDDPARRTFEIVRKPADGLAFALSLAEKRGVTYQRLRARLQR